MAPGGSTIGLREYDTRPRPVQITRRKQSDAERRQSQGLSKSGRWSIGGDRFFVERVQLCQHRGANDRVKVGVIGCGDRMKASLIPAFQEHAKELNFEFVAVSDLWNRRAR